ncbi:thiamine biosynthetic bifunctional enzyme [Dipsacomyces acuminosporus]|nr:thiamine biosynthetic bifunctional enzyme [Dipsacomyces acuminosporus]
MKLDFDLTLYLVTDSSMVPEGKTLDQVVDEAIQGGVTIVQLREKKADTGEFVELARKVQAVTKRHSVPLLINDRVDVALAINADGVHIGQDDMPLSEARRLLGDSKIIGVSVQTPEHAEAAVLGGADYLGIGACYDTNTKQLKNGSQGTEGIRAVWEHAVSIGSTQSDATRPVRAVTIGGINSYNAVHVLICTRTTKGSMPLDGLAVVSAIVAASDPREASRLLRRQIAFAMQSSWVAFQSANASSRDLEHMRQAIASAFDVTKSDAAIPLVQHITNPVVINDCANACLAMGGSPMMATDAQEQGDLAPHVTSLVVNIGTLNPQQVLGMRAALKEAGLHNTPIIIDPVGIGATAYRSEVIRSFLRDFGAHVIKGNAGEIAALVGSDEMRLRGVDAVGKGFSDPGAVVRELGRRERCVVVMTGVIDYVSDGTSTFAVHNGHRLQGCITGSGCMTGTAVGTYIHPVAHTDPLVGALAGMVAINLAGEHAARRPDVKGPGTFRAAFIDEMYNLTKQDLLDEMRIERIH